MTKTYIVWSIWWPAESGPEYDELWVVLYKYIKMAALAILRGKSWLKVRRALAEKFALTFFLTFCKKKAFFKVKTVFLGQEVHYYMVYIAYYKELYLQICN